MIPFDLPNSPLKGVHLLEASAGTGKTYTIAALYVRLILEAAIPVREILVVTFTVAATAELKDRIRRNLRSALGAFTAGRSDNAFLQTLVGACPDEAARRTARERLRAAIRDFDEAAIFTIHGFCQRMLLENAFESGSLFDTELLTDQQRLKTEIVRDFWRTHFYEAPPELVWYALHKGYGPDFLLALTQQVSAHPDIRILHDGDPPSPEAIRRQLEEIQRTFDELKRTWTGARPDILEKLHDPGLKISAYGRGADLLAGDMDRWLTSGIPPFLPFDGFEKLTAGKLAGAVRKGRRPPEHPLFQLCEDLMGQARALQLLLDRCLLSLERKLLEGMRGELTRRKRRRNVLFFDDLLLRLRDALRERGGDELTRAIRGKFRAALIDEFQDTDPVQYAIFQALFHCEDHCLYLIGDPKQAIYGFRGADVFAYLKASSQADRCYSLDQNRRSEPGLVRAINALFGQAADPFVYDRIAFRPTDAAGPSDPVCLTLDGEQEAPLQWWFLPAGSFSTADKPLPVTLAREVIAGTVAAEISRLTGLGRERRACIGSVPLREGDMAVLVRTNREAGLMQRALQAVGIAGVISSEENIFDTHEARELELLLRGLLSRGDERWVRGALATDMLGVGGEALDRLTGDEFAWNDRVEAFRRYGDLWESRGFAGMFRALTAGEGVKPRLLSFPDGERRVTNLLHLAEILHQEASERKLDRRQLLKWLSQQRNAATRSLRDEHLLRLESDANAVRIVTIHKSKGLEYPVVFCPFAWGKSRIEGRAFFYHDEARDYEPVFEIGSEGDSKHRRTAEKERLAENCRLLYVALTRAKHRCYLIWGRINGTASSAPAYLFHRNQGDCRPGPGGGDWLERMEEGFKGLSDEQMQRDLEAIEKKAGGTIRLRVMTGKPAEPLSSLPPDRPDILNRIEFKGKIDASWKVASFSLLLSGQSRTADLPDHDRASRPGMPSGESDEGNGGTAPAGIHGFPGGAKAGIFFHELLEHLDFTETRTGIIAALVAGKLQECGFDKQWVEPLTDSLRKVVRLPLEDPEASKTSDGRPLSLSLIPPSERLNELEFYFPLQKTSGETLNEIFGKAAWWGKGADRLHFSPARGFMHGFIDLVFRHEGRFYLADWKSNLLGRKTTDYHREAMMTAMRENFYFLQYHLYVTALHRYLTLRVPEYRYETHFGGVFYLFLRGMDPESGSLYGVYRDRPREDLIETLSARLTGRPR